MDVGVGEAVGVGLAEGPPAETPPQPEIENKIQPEIESKITKETKGRKTFFIEDPTCVNHCDVSSRAPGCPKLLLDSIVNEFK